MFTLKRIAKKIITFNELQTKEKLKSAVESLVQYIPICESAGWGSRGNDRSHGWRRGWICERDSTLARAIFQATFGRQSDWYGISQILEETKGWVGLKKKKTILMIGYKAVIYMMSLNPNEFPNEEDMQAIRA